MASVVDIVNQSLIRIGQNPIASLTDTTDRAVKANTIYEQVRDEIFASHPWNSLQKRVQLAELADTPNHYYDHQFALPSDFIRLVSVFENYQTAIEHYNDGEGTTYRVILSNHTPLDIVYVARIKDPNRWDTLLQSAISFRLSAELAQALHGSDSMVQSMWTFYNQAMREAQFADSQQSWSRTRIAPASWYRSRFNRGGGMRFFPKVDAGGGEPL